MRQREIERQREEQRRREYEMRLEAEHRRRAEEARRVGLTPVAARNPAEDQRIEELRRRDEELRRIAARRREEERRREQEMQHQQPPPLHHQQQQQHQQHHEHQQRMHEEQRRLEFARQEEQRIRDEQQRLREKERMETTTGRAGMDVLTSSQGRDGDELDTTTPEGVDWEYKSSEGESANLLAFPTVYSYTTANATEKRRSAPARPEKKRTGGAKNAAKTGLRLMVIRVFSKNCPLSLSLGNSVSSGDLASYPVCDYPLKIDPPPGKTTISPRN